MSGEHVLLDREQVWRVIDAQRGELADLLDGLSEEEWGRPSLCAGWTVRDVAAHLTLQQLGLAELVGTMARWRGSMDRTIQDAARREAAALGTGEIVGRIRGMAGSRRHTLGVTYLETLIDVLVHGQDIALPLGRRHPLPAEAAAVATGRVLSMRWPPPPAVARAARGLRLAATDLPWTAGDGPLVQGPMGAILLACTGRRAGLEHLTGPGVTGLAAHLT